MTLLKYAALAALGLAGMAALQGFKATPDDDGLVRLDDVSVIYRQPGEFLQDETPVNGPLAEIRLKKSLTIMRNQVTRGDYERCVAAGACDPLDTKGDPALPLGGVNFNDAVTYAAWLSEETGEQWRLPTDREWALAAGSRFKDDAYTEISDPNNPAKRWMAVYDAEAETQKETETQLMPAGHFGENEHGLVDLSGSVWEWTSTCYVRHHTRTGEAPVVTENCGVRIAEGSHRAFMTAFFRDPKAGACSIGIPPANLGIRLVKEERGVLEWLGF